MAHFEAAKLVALVARDASEFPSESLRRDVAHVLACHRPAVEEDVVRHLVVHSYYGTHPIDLSYVDGAPCVRDVSRAIECRLYVPPVRQRLFFETTGEIDSESTLPLGAFRLRDGDKAYVLWDTPWWEGVASFAVSMVLLPQPNATIGCCDPVRLYVQGNYVLGGAEERSEDSCFDSVGVVVHEIPPVLKRREADGSIACWRRHEALLAARALATRLPDELVRHVLTHHMTIAAETWEPSTHSEPIRASVDVSREGDASVTIRPCHGRWKPHAHYRVQASDHDRPPLLKIHRHPLVDVDDDRATSRLLRGHDAFRTWHFYTDGTLHQPLQPHGVTLHRAWR